MATCTVCGERATAFIRDARMLSQRDGVANLGFAEFSGAFLGEEGRIEKEYRDRMTKNHPSSTDLISCAVSTNSSRSLVLWKVSLH
jgi:hypothetical protein